MRLRLLVPRRGRGRGFRALAAGAALGLALAGCGDGDDARPRPQPPPPRPPLVVGLTEANPSLYSPGAVAPGFTAARDRLAALRPELLRVLVVWSQLQPSPEAAPDWDKPADGCLRGRPPCAPFAGIRDQLRAAREADLEVVITILGAPEWAAAPASGCERDDTPATARRVVDLDAYRALVRSLLAEAGREGVELRWWSPWNEPNHPAFLNPQRERCDPDAPTTADDAYVPLVRALREELTAAPGDQGLVIGEVAGIEDRRDTITAAAEFAAALPDEVVCAADVWAQHAYVEVRDEGDLAGDVQPPGSGPMLRRVAAALDRPACGREEPLPIWITETGVDPEAGRAGCRAMAQALERWSDDPQVAAAFQYTYRADTEFDVGLADAALGEVRPAYAAWAGEPC
jgi:hypothetical protein